jgi:CO/xanthine dehydrogenase Mo-binding subunit
MASDQAEISKASSSYQVLRMDEAPATDVHIVESTEPPGGTGETSASTIVEATHTSG